ncbi:MAG: hypothetical protein C0483_23155 [Pirellula sp.]|nr:hypothetical protein [Pirellula sp.]
MSALLRTSIAVAIFAACLALIAYAFIEAPEWAHKPEPAGVGIVAVSEPLAPLPLEATFTTAGRSEFEGLALSFKYPNFWEYGAPNPHAVDATVRIMRPGSNPIRATIVLLVTRSPTAFDAPKPIVPPGAKLLTARRRPLGTTEIILAEFVTATPLEDYQHVIMLESATSTRYVSLTATCHGPTGSKDVIDRQFEELRATFEAVLSSLKFEDR